MYHADLLVFTREDFGKWYDAMANNDVCKGLIIA